MRVGFTIPSPSRNVWDDVKMWFCSNNFFLEKTCSVMQETAFNRWFVNMYVMTCILNHLTEAKSWIHNEIEILLSTLVLEFFIRFIWILHTVSGYYVRRAQLFMSQRQAYHLSSLVSKEQNEVNKTAWFFSLFLSLFEYFSFLLPFCLYSCRQHRICTWLPVCFCLILCWTYTTFRE